MPETDAQRNEAARELAYAQGKREAIVDGRLDSAEARLTAINGSIEKHALNAMHLREAIDQQNDKIDQIVAKLDQRAAVEADRVEQLRQANDRQISTRAFAIGVATIVVMILGLIVTLLVEVHAI